MICPFLLRFLNIRGSTRFPFNLRRRKEEEEEALLLSRILIVLHARELDGGNPLLLHGGINQIDKPPLHSPDSREKNAGKKRGGAEINVRFSRAIDQRG